VNAENQTPSSQDLSTDELIMEEGLTYSDDLRQELLSLEDLPGLHYVGEKVPNPDNRHTLVYLHGLDVPLDGDSPLEALGHHISKFQEDEDLDVDIMVYVYNDSDPIQDIAAGFNQALDGAYLSRGTIVGYSYGAWIIDQAILDDTNNLYENMNRINGSDTAGADISKFLEVFLFASDILEAANSIGDIQMDMNSAMALMDIDNKIRLGVRINIENDSLAPDENSDPLHLINFLREQNFWSSFEINSRSDFPHGEIARRAVVVEMIKEIIWAHEDEFP